MDKNIEKNTDKNEVAEKNDNSKKTYEAIIDSIKTDIMNGRIKPGQKLPPER